MSYDIKRALRSVEEAMELMEAHDTAYLKNYALLARKARVLRRVLRLFERLEKKMEGLA